LFARDGVIQFVINHWPTAKPEKVGAAGEYNTPADLVMTSD